LSFVEEMYRKLAELRKLLTVLILRVDSERQGAKC
jgi:hypothetical protein